MSLFLNQSSVHYWASTRAKIIVQYLTMIASPLAAALAFILQPAMGKLLLPRLGGTAATWLGTALFFQLSLLLGYAFGLWLSRQTFRKQWIALAAISILAVTTFHTPDGLSGEPSVIGVLFSLSIACLPAMTLLFSLSPWLHTWRERVNLREPYALYAISNIGSLLALLIYPFVIEPYVMLEDQLMFWKALLLLLSTVLIAGMGLLFYSSGHHGTTKEPSKARDIPLLHYLSWVALAALVCVSMLAVSQLIAAEIGSTPLAWVGPLGVYLLSFSVIFSGRWSAWMTGLSAIGLTVSLAFYMTYKGFGSGTIDGGVLFITLACCGFSCFTGHALLYETRPSRGGEWFYLALAFGGVVGGITSIWFVPTIFIKPVEFAVTSGLILAAGLWWGAKNRHIGSLSVCVTITLSPVLIYGKKQASDERLGDGVLNHYRDVYGHLMVKTNPTGVVLSSATTSHGSQLIETDAARRRPTLYYTESSAVGRSIQALQAERLQLNIAVVGLGTGTLATYLRRGDSMTFYDIDPKIESVARKHFSFLADAQGEIRVEIADGRRALEAASSQAFDIIVIDAFMGDSVPAHLLTREAMQIYMTRLQRKQGLLAVHASTRYSDLYPTIAVTAHSLGLVALKVRTEIHNSLERRDWDAAQTTYILIGEPRQLPTWLEWLPVEEDDSRVTRTLTLMESAVIGAHGVWSDERNSALDSLSLSEWIFRRTP